MLPRYIIRVSTKLEQICTKHAGYFQHFLKLGNLDHHLQCNLGIFDSIFGTYMCTLFTDDWLRACRLITAALVLSDIKIYDLFRNIESTREVCLIVFYFWIFGFFWSVTQIVRLLVLTLIRY